MAEITIRFRYDRKTGAKEMVVHLESDDDLLPHEHERDHRAWVESLIGQPIEEDTTVVIERTAPEGEAEPAGREEQVQAARDRQKS